VPRVDRGSDALKGPPAALPKLGVFLGAANPSAHVEIALEAERLGYESVWMPEHLVLPAAIAGSPYPGAEHPPVAPHTPVYDAFAWLCFLAGKTTRIRLGTNVTLLAIRHPFVAARGVATLDVVSGGRAEVGIGAGWLRAEWEAAGLDPRTRGRRLDEALGVCKRLWTEREIEHHGEFYSFAPVAFEPKPLQRPWPRIHVGGESAAALTRAARDADGWIGMAHTRESIAAPLAKIAEVRDRFERWQEPFEVTVMGEVATRDDLSRWGEAGATRVIVAPWKRTRDALDGLRRLAELAY
jgi:probable F420-dependent oxidoreductase